MYIIEAELAHHQGHLILLSYAVTFGFNELLPDLLGIPEHAIDLDGIGLERGSPHADVIVIAEKNIRVAGPVDLVEQHRIIIPFEHGGRPEGQHQINQPFKRKAEMFARDVRSGIHSLLLPINPAAAQHPLNDGQNQNGKEKHKRNGRAITHGAAEE